MSVVVKNTELMRWKRIEKIESRAKLQSEWVLFYQIEIFI